MKNTIKIIAVILCLLLGTIAYAQIVYNRAGWGINLAGDFNWTGTHTFTIISVPVSSVPSAGDACSLNGAIKIDTDGAVGSKIIWCNGSTWQVN